MDTTYVFISVFICFIYIGFNGIMYPTMFSIGQYPYYNYFIDGLLHNRLDFDKPWQTMDLSYYHGKWYIFWGISAIFFIFPFYFVQGIKTSDVFYTFIAGLANIVLFFFLIKEFSRTFNLNLERIHIICAVISFALASPNLYLTEAAAVWHTSQILCIFYWQIFFIYYLKFWKKPRYIFLLISVLFFNLAWTTRYLLITNGILFLILLYRIFQKKIVFSRRKSVVTIVGITLCFLCLIGIYNYIRFNSVFETGLSHQVGNVGTSFSLKNIPHSLETYFLLKTYDSSEPIGWGRIIKTTNIFILYPYILVGLWGIFKKFAQTEKYPGIQGLIVIVFINSIIICFYQMAGPRYFFDIIPHIYLLGLIGSMYISRKILILITIYGVLINTIAMASYIGFV